MLPVTSGRLPFSGKLRGCAQFRGFIERTSLYQKLQWGFQFLIPDAVASDGEDGTPLSEWMPLADFNVGPTDDLGFDISIDPTDRYNEVFDPCAAKHAPWIKPMIQGGPFLNSPAGTFKAPTFGWPAIFEQSLERILT